MVHSFNKSRPSVGLSFLCIWENGLTSLRLRGSGGPRIDLRWDSEADRRRPERTQLLSSDSALSDSEP